ncbi:MAG: tetratricopeptide repeat protein [Bacteroidales bacterium]
MVTVCKLSRLAGLLLVLIVAGCGNPNDNDQKKLEVSKESNNPLGRLDSLNRAISADSANPDLFYQRAKYYLDHEAFNEAFKDITSALELDSSYSPYYVTLSDVYLSMNKLQKSVEALEKAIEINNSETDAYLRLAEISIVVGDYRKAFANIDHALRVDELSERAYFLRAIALLETGDTIRAIKNLQRSIEVNQDYFDPYVQLARLYAGKKNKLAVDYYNAALNLQPDNLEILYSLAMFYQNTGEYDKAISKYNLILEKDPTFYFALYNIGYIQLVYLEDYASAVDYFTQAIDLKPDYVEAWYNRGFARELMKDVQNAYQDYQKALEYRPNYDKAVQGLNRIDLYLKTQANQ